jgi:hypothetical protein
MSNPLKDKKPAAWGAIWRTVKAVAWSFLGVRRNSEFQEDIAKISPFHIIVVGIVGALLFVGSLMALVNWVVAH